MPFGCGLGWTQVGLSIVKWSARWQHVANTSERSMFCGDAALCHISLNICCTIVLLKPVYMMQPVVKLVVVQPVVQPVCIVQTNIQPV